MTANVTLHFDGNEFRARCDFDSRLLLKESGFRFDNDAKQYYTNSYPVAARFRDYADEKAKKEIDRKILRVTPWTKPLRFPSEFKLKDYQETSALWALSRDRSYLALDAGLGKTIVASTVMSTLNHHCPSIFVYICPSFLTRNVENEINTWAPELWTHHYDSPEMFSTVLIIPDSLFAYRDITEHVSQFLSYSGHGRRRVLFVDEAHRYKSQDSERTRVLLGHQGRHALVDLFDQVVCMSGDPLANRPLELYPVLSKLAPDSIGFISEDEYGQKFCAGHYREFPKRGGGEGRSWDFSGASNMEELASRVQEKYMIRVRKDALPLPPLIEEVLIASEDMTPELVSFEQSILKRYPIEDLMRGEIEEEYQHDNMHLMTYQRLLGLKKIKPAMDWIENVYEETNEAMIVFARHTDTVKSLYDASVKKGFNPLTIGGVSAKDRQSVIDEFQKSKTKRILIGNIRAMGIGFNITKATRVLNVEPDWVPMINNQGRDRAHRFGQTKTVYMQHLAMRNSIDHIVLNAVLRKTKLQSYF